MSETTTIVRTSKTAAQRLMIMAREEGITASAFLHWLIAEEWRRRDGHRPAVQQAEQSEQVAQP